MTRTTDRKGRGARLRVEHFVSAGNVQGGRVSMEHQEQDTGIMIDTGRAAGHRDIRVIDSQNL